MRRVVVTGLGLVTPLGGDVETSWKNLIAGKSGAAQITRFDTEGQKCTIACEVKPKDHEFGFDPDKRVDHKVQRQVDPFIVYGIDAAGQALEDAGLVDMDDELKLLAMTGFVKYQGDAQALAWRGENYVRIAGLHGFSEPMHLLTQLMKTLTEPDRECVICFDVINDDKTVDGIVTGRRQFTCMHSICRKCYKDKKMDSCPECRCEDSLDAAMKKILSKAPTGKDKKKMRAAARRNR